jgi:hypothetical protein
MKVPNVLRGRRGRTIPLKGAAGVHNDRLSAEPNH